MREAHEKGGPKESRSHNAHIRQNDAEIMTVIREKEGHDIMIKGSIQEEDITIINIDAPNIRALNIRA